ncbi:hypothetical protein [Variovorax sp. J31P207]|uniref:hypothetical protein n=1 Tax=Variovorax sp. J31P207 TaxID=3053510 RepID=UPI002577711E|nr:hypothetical protein [Variovorax sp. J31P207]MDM0070395.1 hypothetical protein [Variovorax sp. J31P207]
MIPLELILPISVTMGLLTSGLIGVWYVWPRVRAMPARDALVALIFPHCFRYLGLSFLIHGVTTAPMDHRFSFPTAYGDLLTAILGLVSIAALRANSRFAIPLVWIFSVVGVVDFLNAFARGLTFAAPGDFGATYYIPMVVVPPLMVGHALILARLRAGPKYGMQA